MRPFVVVRVAAGALAVPALLVVLFSACIVDILDPTVTILSPRDGGVEAGEVLVRYVVSDNRGVRRVELYVDGELRDTVSNPESDTLTYLLNLMATAKDTSHTVRVEATDAAENRAQAQVTFFGYGRMPTAPVLLSPAAWDTLRSNQVRFSWLAAASAAMYYLQVSRDSGFRQLVLDDSTTEIQYLASAECCGNNVEVERTSSSALAIRHSPLDHSTTPLQSLDSSIPRPLLLKTSHPVPVSRTDSGHIPASSGGGLDNGIHYWRLRVRTTYGLTSDWSSGRAFLVAALPEAIRLLSPANGTVVPNSTPSFLWLGARNADKYRIELADNPGMSSPFISSTVSDTSYTPTGPLPDMRLYWRVKGQNWLGSYGEPSAVWSLVVVSGPPLPPELVYPPANSTIAESLPVLVWRSRPGADSYCVELSLDPDFAAWSDSAIVTDTAFRTYVPLADTLWYWRVKARNAFGWGTFQSSPSRFTVVAKPPRPPVLVAPANRSRTAATRPQFVWRSSSFADRYHIAVAADSGFRSVVFSDSLGDTTCTPTNDLTEGTWYWRVRAGNTVGWGPFGDSAWSFTVITQGPPPPRLIQPDSAATVTTSRPTFAWTGRSKETRVGVTRRVQPPVALREPGRQIYAGYWLEVATDPGFGNVVLSDSSLRDTNHTPTDTLPDGLLYWRVRARDELGLWGPAANPWPFTVLTRVPIPPGLLVPQQGETLVTNPVRMTWSRVATGTHYHLQVDDDPGFDSPFVDDSTLTDTTYAESLPDYSVSYWRVRAANQAGWSDWSQMRWFAVVTRVPGPLAQLFPPDDTLVSQGYVSFLWQGAAWARKYWLELAYDSGFSSILHRDSTLSDTFSEVGPLPDTTLYWRVRAQNFRGWGGWQSSPWRLRVLARLPEAPSLLQPIPGDTLTENPVQMSWSSVPGAVRHHVQLADNPDFTSPFVNDTAVGETTYLQSLSDYSTTWWRVRCRNVAGWGPWQTTPGWFCVVTVVPGPVGLVLPAPDTTLTTNQVTFVWHRAQWARAYSLEVGFDSLFTSVFFADSGLTDTACLVLSLPDTMFYWRVRARNKKGWGEWPPTPRRLNVVSNTPQPPILVLPAQGDTMIENPVAMVWQPTAPAQRYHIQLADNPSFNAPFVDDSLVTDTTWAESLPDYSVTWWRVRGRNAAGWGAWTSPARWYGVVTQVPGILTQVYPPHDTTVTISQVTFVWRPATWPRKYWLEVAFDTGFSRTVLRDSGLTDTFRQVIGLADSNYYWRVRAQNKKGWGEWQLTPRRLTVITQTPQVPDLLLPLFGDTLIANPAWMVWSQSPTASRYRVQLADNPGFSPVLLDDSTLTDTSFLYFLPDYSRTFWRVRARNVVGWSQWTAPAYWFCVVTRPPGELSQVYPAPDTTLITSQTEFIWQTGFWARQYALQVALDADFTSLVLQDTTLADTTRLSGSLADSTYYWRVRGRNRVGWGSWQTVPRRFAILTQPPPAPVPLSPAQGDTLTANPVQMRWLGLPDARRYWVQLAENPDFDSLIADDSTLTDTSFRHSLPDYSINYWRVRARNLFDWGPWSNPVRWFGVVTQVPDPVARISPAPDTTITTDQALFTWLPAQWARRYALEVAYDAGFSHIFLRDTNILTTQRLVTSLSDTVYYWRIRAQNKKGWGAWQSEPWALRVLTTVPPAPILTLPVSGDTLTVNPVAMFWHNLPGVLRWQVQLDDDPGFGSPFVDDSLTTDTTIARNLPDYSKTYWRVRARNLAGWSDWSASPRWFCVVTQVPDRIERISPPDDTTVTTQSPTFCLHSLTWSRKDGGQLSYDSLFTVFYANDSGVTDTARFVSGLADTAYYWRVSAQNRKGWGAWQSDAWRLHVQTLVPPVPVLALPAEGDTITDNPVFMHWRPSLTATRYRIQLADNPSFVSPLADDSTLTDTFFSRSLLDYSYTWWRVAARNAAGWSNWSPTRSFGTVTVVPPVLTRTWPPHDTTMVAGQTTLCWNQAVWIRVYHVQVSADSVFGSLALDDTLVTDTFRLTGSLADSTWYWRVRARNRKGWGAWQTDLRRFTLLTQPPASPLLLQPLLGDTLTDNPIHMVWRSQRTALRYRVQLADNPSFSSPFVDDSTLTDTTYAESLLDYSATWWRVRARNLAGWSDWSTVRYFGVVTTVPSVLTRLEPPDDTTVTTDSTNFHWRPATWSRKYWLQLAIDSLFTDVYLSDSTLAETTRLVTSLADTVFYWRVRAQNKKGWGPWQSEPWSLRVLTTVPPVPVLTLPASDDTLTVNPVEMYWRNLAGILRWQVQLDDDPGFGSPFVDDSTLTDTIYAESLPDYSVTWWRVRARNLAGWSDWSASPRWFCVVTSLPDTIIRLFPPDDTTIADDEVDLIWQPGLWCRHYWVQLSLDSGFTNLILDDSTASDSVRPVTELDDTTYYWRVKVRNKVGWGEWQQAVWSFTVMSHPLLPSPFTGDPTFLPSPLMGEGKREGSERSFPKTRHFEKDGGSP